MPEPASETLLLQNGVVAVTLLRADGRVASWSESATGTELLSAPVGLELVGLAPDPGGFLAMRDEEAGELLLDDPFGHDGVGVQTLYRLEPGANALAVRVSLLNRTRESVALRLRWHGEAAVFDPPTFVRRDGFWEDGLVLAGRTVVSLDVLCAAFGPDLSVSPEAGIGWDEAAVTLRVARALEGAQLFLATDGGETLEAPVSVKPESALVLPLGGVRPVAAVLRDAGGREILRTDATPSVTELPVFVAGESIAWESLEDSALARLGRDPAKRPLAAIERARRAALAGEDAPADSALEDALLWNADDPLTWWAKAVVQRRLAPARDRAEWLNARFLRPLEPLVAAEALLNQEPEGPEEGNPLMGLVAGREASAAMCVAAYAEAGYVREATSLAARVLAVRDWRRVRMLAAGLYLAHTRMTVQAAEHFAAAARAESEGEPPARGIEAELGRSVRERFERLK